MNHVMLLEQGQNTIQPRCYPCLYQSSLPYGDVVMGTVASQITSLTIVYSTVYSGQENIKAPRHWPLCGEITGDRWIPRTNGQLRGKCFHLMTSSCMKGSSIIRAQSQHTCPNGKLVWRKTRPDNSHDIKHSSWVEKSHIPTCLFLIHRPKKVLGHLPQRVSHSKHHIGNGLSRRPSVVGCWNFAWLCTIRSVERKYFCSVHTQWNIHISIA